MIRTIASVATLLFGVAILLAGQGLQGVLLPVRAGLEGFSMLAIGFIGGTYFLGFTLGCWHGARLIARVGHVRVFAAMTAAASASPLLHGLWVNVWSWGALRMLSGFCFAVLYVVIESWLNEQSTNENRGTVFSTYIFINMTVLAVGQQILLLDDPRNLGLFAISSVLVSLAAVPVALSTSQAPREIRHARLQLARLYRTSPAGMLGSLTAGLANGAFWSLAPVFTAAYSGDVRLAAWFMTAGVLGGAAGQWPLGRLSDKVDRRSVLIGVSITGVVVAAALWRFAAQIPLPGILALGFLWGAMAFPLYSISVAHANDRVEADDYVPVSSGLLLMYGAGAVTGPFLASALMTASDFAGLFLFSALAHGLLAMLILWRSLQRAPDAVEHHTEFSDALTSALTASQVYPRDQAERRAAGDALGGG